VSGVLLTLFQILISRGGLRSVASTDQPYDYIPGTAPRYANGLQRAYDHARQRGIADGVNQMLAAGRMVKFNVGPERIRRSVSYIEGVDPIYWNHQDDHHGERFPEPAQGLEQVYQKAVNECDAMMRAIEIYSHYGIFTFVEKYHMNWISRNRGKDTVLRAMLDLLFPLTPVDAVWEEYKNYHWENQPEEIWQFSRERYRWAKDQWPNLSDRITTVWTLQDLGMIPDDVDVSTVIAVNAHNDLKRVEIHVSGPNSEVAKQSADIRPATDSVASDGEENQL
jgi:hypothetical protein